MAIVGLFSQSRSGKVAFTAICWWPFFLSRLATSMLLKVVLHLDLKAYIFIVDFFFNS